MFVGTALAFTTHAKLAVGAAEEVVATQCWGTTDGSSAPLERRKRKWTATTCFFVE
jgi:hypothetical protein